MTTVEIRRASPSDADRVCELIRTTFDPRLVSRTIYSDPKAALWLAAELDLPQELQLGTYLVATQPEGILGYVDLRAQADTAHLNYIAVDGTARGRGIGSTLLAAALADGGVGHLVLDVLEDNDLARGWYRRLGLIEEGHRLWIERSLPGSIQGPGSVPPGVGGLAAAMVQQRACGFGEFSVTPAGGVATRVGILGESYFRLQAADLGSCTDIVASLRAIDATRRMLSVTDAAPPGWDVAVTMVVMRGMPR